MKGEIKKMKISQESLDEVAAVSRYYGMPLYCLYIGDNCRITFKHLNRDDLMDYDKEEFIQQYGDVAMFETKQEALEYLAEEQPALIKLLDVGKSDGWTKPE